MIDQFLRSGREYHINGVIDMDRDSDGATSSCNRPSAYPIIQYNHNTAQFNLVRPFLCSYSSQSSLSFSLFAPSQSLSLLLSFCPFHSSSSLSAIMKINQDSQWTVPFPMITLPLLLLFLSLSISSPCSPLLFPYLSSSPSLSSPSLCLPSPPPLFSSVLCCVFFLSPLTQSDSLRHGFDLVKNKINELSYDPILNTYVSPISINNNTDNIYVHVDYVNIYSNTSTSLQQLAASVSDGLFPSIPYIPHVIILPYSSAATQNAALGVQQSENFENIVMITAGSAGDSVFITDNHRVFPTLFALLPPASKQFSDQMSLWNIDGVENVGVITENEPYSQSALVGIRGNSEDYKITLSEYSFGLPNSLNQSYSDMLASIILTHYPPLDALILPVNSVPTCTTFLSSLLHHPLYPSSYLSISLGACGSVDSDVQTMTNGMKQFISVSKGWAEECRGEDYVDNVFFQPIIYENNGTIMTSPERFSMEYQQAYSGEIPSRLHASGAAMGILLTLSLSQLSNITDIYSPSSLISAISSVYSSSFYGPISFNPFGIIQQNDQVFKQFDGSQNQWIITPLASAEIKLIYPIPQSVTIEGDVLNYHVTSSFYVLSFIFSIIGVYICCMLVEQSLYHREGNDHYLTIFFTILSSCCFSVVGIWSVAYCLLCNITMENTSDVMGRPLDSLSQWDMVGLYTFLPLLTVTVTVFLSFMIQLSSLSKGKDKVKSTGNGSGHKKKMGSDTFRGKTKVAPLESTVNHHHHESGTEIGTESGIGMGTGWNTENDGSTKGMSGNVSDINNRKGDKEESNGIETKRILNTSFSHRILLILHSLFPTTTKTNNNPNFHTHKRHESDITLSSVMRDIKSNIIQLLYDVFIHNFSLSSLCSSFFLLISFIQCSYCALLSLHGPFTLSISLSSFLPYFIAFYILSCIFGVQCLFFTKKKRAMLAIVYGTFNFMYWQQFVQGVQFTYQQSNGGDEGTMTTVSPSTVSLIILCVSVLSLLLFILIGLQYGAIKLSTNEFESLIAKMRRRIFSLNAVIIQKKGIITALELENEGLKSNMEQLVQIIRMMTLLSPYCSTDTAVLLMSQIVNGEDGIQRGGEGKGKGIVSNMLGMSLLSSMDQMGIMSVGKSGKGMNSSHSSIKEVKPITIGNNNNPNATITTVNTANTTSPHHHLARRLSSPSDQIAPSGPTVIPSGSNSRAHTPFPTNMKKGQSDMITSNINGNGIGSSQTDGNGVLDIFVNSHRLTPPPSSPYPKAEKHMESNVPASSLHDANNHNDPLNVRSPSPSTMTTLPKLMGNIHQLTMIRKDMDNDNDNDNEDNEDNDKDTMMNVNIQRNDIEMNVVGAEDNGASFPSPTMEIVSSIPLPLSLTSSSPPSPLSPLFTSSPLIPLSPSDMVAVPAISPLMENPNAQFASDSLLLFPSFSVSFEQYDEMEKKLNSKDNNTNSAMSTMEGSLSEPNDSLSSSLSSPLPLSLVLLHPISLTLFKNFLLRELSSENLYFWLRLQQWKCIESNGQNYLQKKYLAKILIQQFLSPRSQWELNVPSGMKKEMMGKFTSLSEEFKEEKKKEETIFIANHLEMMEMGNLMMGIQENINSPTATSPLLPSASSPSSTSSSSSFSLTTLSTLFDSIEKEIYLLMSKDSYGRFTDTMEYKLSCWVIKMIPLPMGLTRRGVIWSHWNGQGSGQSQSQIQGNGAVGAENGGSGGNDGDDGHHDDNGNGYCRYDTKINGNVSGNANGAVGTQNGKNFNFRALSSL